MSDGPTAALLQQIFEIDPLACSACNDAMRIVAFITQTSVIDQILAHFRARAARKSHAGPLSPHQRGPTRAGARHTPSARPPTPRPLNEYAPPNAPRPRGAVQRSRPSHRRVRLVPTGFGHPAITAVRTALMAPERDGGHAAARQAAPAKSPIAPYARRIVDRPRLKFLSRLLELLTTEPGLQVYAGGTFTPGLTGPRDFRHPNFGGIALETQEFPDASNHRQFPSTILRPGVTYESRTVRRFGCVIQSTTV